MTEYDTIPDSPDSPTDVDAEDELDFEGDGYYPTDNLLSPLDPNPLTRAANRETAGHEFFSAVFLDSPLHPAEKEELEEAMFGRTRLLRVKKKVAGVRIAGLGPAGERPAVQSLDSPPYPPCSRPRRSVIDASAAPPLKRLVCASIAPLTDVLSRTRFCIYTDSCHRISYRDHLSHNTSDHSE